MAKHRRLVVCLLIGVGLAVSGCRTPRLAARPLTERETAWAETIRARYSAWDPPYQPQLLPAPAAAFRSAPPGALPLPENRGMHLGLREPLSVPLAADEIELVPMDEPGSASVQLPCETYTVRKGDTLSAIARRYYGTGTALEWRRLADFNRDVLASPNQLRPGMVLKIPGLPAVP